MKMRIARRAGAVIGILLVLSISDAVAFNEADLARLRATGHCSLCDLSSAQLAGVDLTGADLRGADLRAADLRRVDLTDADLTGADLRKTDLRKALMLNTRLEKANLSGSAVHGVSVWGAKLDGAIQAALSIAPSGQSTLTVDNLETAQFVYMLLDNRKLHDAIDSLTAKIVLILGRFTPRRKAVLDSVRAGLRQLNYAPIIFDFSKPERRDLSETVSLLAHLSRFVIADITEAKSIPQELMLIVPNLPSVPVQPILQNGFDDYSMFEHMKHYGWVLPIHRYDGVEDIVSSLPNAVVGPAEAKAREIAGP